MPGRKPKTPYVKLVTGNPGRRPIDVPSGPELREGPLKAHGKLTKAQAAIWKRYIDTAPWLTEHDAPKAYAWVCLQARHDEDPAEFTAALHGQLRMLAAELGLDLSTRARLGISTKRDDDPNSHYFS